MKLLQNLVKGLLLLALIFGVLYFGLDYYFKQQGKAPDAAAAPSKTAEELTLLHEELSILEQKIQDLRRENRPFADEQEAVDNLKADISRLKQEMASNLPSEASRGKPAAVMPGVPQATGLFADDYRRVFIIAICALVAFLFAFFIFRAVASRRAKPLRRATAETGEHQRMPPPPRQRPREKPLSETRKEDDFRLKETLDRFKAASAVIQKSETREVPLEAVRPEPPAKRAAAEPRPEPALEAAPPPRTGAPVRDLALIDKVFDLDRQGLSIEDISGKLHVDQDQVRLILRFKR